MNSWQAAAAAVLPQKRRAGISTGPVENSVEKEATAAFRAHQFRRFFSLHKKQAILRSN
jgi:hypothetical protein